MNGGLEPGIAQEATRMRRLRWWERRILFVNNVDRVAAALLAFLLFIVDSLYSRCTLKHSDSEVTDVTF